MTPDQIVATVILGGLGVASVLAIAVGIWVATAGVEK